MDRIEFERESYGRPISSVTPKRFWATNLVMKIGGKYVKTEEQASKILVIISIIFFIISIYNFIS